MQNYKSVADSVDELIPSASALEIFAAVFRWLTNPAQTSIIPTLDQDVITGIREGKSYGCLRREFGKRFASATLHYGISARLDGDLVLALSELDGLRTALRVYFKDGKDFVLPVLLALLDAIDAEYGHILELDRPQSQNRFSFLWTLSENRAIWKPRSAFGSDSISNDNRPPEYGPDVRQLRFERLFGNLLVPSRDTLGGSLQPAVLGGPVLAHIRENEPWRIAMISILADIDDIAWTYPAGRFWGESISSNLESKVIERLKWALEICREAHTDIILLPELNVSPALRKELERFAAEGAHLPRLIICGQLHQTCDPDASTFYNRPLIIGSNGEIPWQYWKYAPMEVSRTAFTRNPDDRNFRHGEALGSCPEYVVAVDLPIGRLSVVICLDFLQDTVHRALLALRANVIAVIAMTGPTSVTSFKEKAHDHAAGSQAVTFFCNSSLHYRAGHHRVPAVSAYSAPTGDEPVLGFVHLNQRVRTQHLHTHELPETRTTVATVGLYELNRPDPSAEARLDVRTVSTPDCVIRIEQAAARHSG